MAKSLADRVASIVIKMQMAEYFNGPVAIQREIFSRWARGLPPLDKKETEKRMRRFRHRRLSRKQRTVNQ